MKAYLFVVLAFLPLGKADAYFCSTFSCGGQVIPTDCQLPQKMCARNDAQELMVEIEAEIELQVDPEYMEGDNSGVVE